MRKLSKSDALVASVIQPRVASWWHTRLMPTARPYYAHVLPALRPDISLERRDRVSDAYDDLVHAAVHEEVFVPPLDEEVASILRTVGDTREFTVAVERERVWRACVDDVGCEEAVSAASREPFEKGGELWLEVTGGWPGKERPAEEEDEE